MRPSSCQLTHFDDDDDDDDDEYVYEQGRNILYSPDSSNEDGDNDTDSDYLNIAMPSDCRLKQIITPTNSPQSHSIQHSPHHAISVLSSILAKYENNGLLERRKHRDEAIWSRQANSERTSPRMRSVTAAITDGEPTTRRNRSDCYCSMSSASTSSPRSAKLSHAICANLKTRALSLPQCSFTLAGADFQQTLLQIAASNDAARNMLACCDLHCKCVKMPTKAEARPTDVRAAHTADFCNCTGLHLTTTGDVLETTC